MNMRRLAVAAASALLLPWPDGGGAAADPWERLVRRLGGAAVADREAAERELVAAGAAALPPVVAARPAAVGETAFRLEWIQRELEGRAAEAAVEPAVVSLVARDLPARTALAQVFARCRGGIDLAPEVSAGAVGATPVTLSLERATFWEAVDAVLDAAGLALEYRAAGPPPDAGAALRIAAAPGGRAAAEPHVAAGPLRVAVAGVEPAGPPRPDGTGAAPPGRSRGARVTLRVAFEPGLEPLLVRLSARSIVAEGAAGEAMPVAQRAAVVEAAVPRGRSWIDVPVRLAAPAEPLAALAMLRGTLDVWCAGLDYGFRFPGVRPRPGAAALPSQRVAAATVRLLECAAEGERVTVRASITYDAPSEALASHHSWLAARPLEAFAAGHAADRPGGGPERLEPIEQRVESRSDRGLTAAAVFRLPAGGDAGHPREVEIRWMLPAAIHTVPIDFAIRDVPLPAAPGP